MKKYRTILPLFIMPLFLSTSFVKKVNRVESKLNDASYDDLKRKNTIAEYEVRLTFTGYTTFFSGPPDCPVRTTGTVVLAGLLSGLEDVNSYDDITYRGVLQLKIDMDICSVKRLANGEDKLCVMTVTGSGPVNTELKLYFNGPGQDSARGGWIKINYETNLGPFTKNVTGDCDVEQTTEELDMVPNKTIASIFNGTELPMLKQRTLRKGSYTETSPSGRLEVAVIRKVQ